MSSRTELLRAFANSKKLSVLVTLVWAALGGSTGLWACDESKNRDRPDASAGADTDSTTCYQEGRVFDARTPGSVCCGGLTQADMTDVGPDGICRFVGGPAAKICVRCGDRSCGPGETSCNCASDCK